MKKIPLSEIYRKVIHSVSIFIPLSYLWLIKDQSIMIIILTVLCSVSLLLEFLRNKSNTVKFLFNNMFIKMLRKNEKKGTLTGATWLLIGSLITTIFFPIYIVVPALIYLSIGDSFAAIIGKAYPFGKIGVKSITGSISGALASSIFAISVNKILPIEIIIIGSIIAMLIEIIPIKLNDNLTIPFISALVMNLSLNLL